MLSSLLFFPSSLILFNIRRSSSFVFTLGRLVRLLSESIKYKSLTPLYPHLTISWPRTHGNLHSWVTPRYRPWASLPCPQRAQASARAWPDQEKRIEWGWGGNISLHLPCKRPPLALSEQLASSWTAWPGSEGKVNYLLSHIKYLLGIYRNLQFWCNLNGIWRSSSSPKYWNTNLYFFGMFLFSRCDLISLHL